MFRQSGPTVFCSQRIRTGKVYITINFSMSTPGSSPNVSLQKSPEMYNFSKALFFDFRPFFEVSVSLFS